MNVLTVSGHLGKDCSSRQVGQNTVTAFSVAVKSGYGQNEQTNWIDCSIWGKRGDSLAPYLNKGQQVIVSGELSIREHDGKRYVQVRVSEIDLVGGRTDKASEPAGQGGQAPASDFDDDIPFK